MHHANIKLIFLYKYFFYVLTIIVRILESLLLIPSSPKRDWLGWQCPRPPFIRWVRIAGSECWLIASGGIVYTWKLGSFEAAATLHGTCINQVLPTLIAATTITNDNDLVNVCNVHHKSRIRSKDAVEITPELGLW